MVMTTINSKGKIEKWMASPARHSITKIMMFNGPKRKSAIKLTAKRSNAPRLFKPPKFFIVLSPFSAVLPLREIVDDIIKSKTIC